MKIELKRPIMLDNGKRASAGTVIEYPDARAKTLIRRGYAVPRLDAKLGKPKAKTPDGREIPVGPTHPLPIGGPPIGERQPSSALPADQPQETTRKRSRKRGARRKSSR